MNFEERLLELEATVGIQPKLLKVPAAARILNTDPAHLRTLIKSGKIPAVCLNPSAKSKHYRVSIQQIFDALKTR